MIFRKHISLILAFLLLVSNTGLAFNVHFCADVVASITINSDLNSKEIEQDCCGITEEKSQCCDNKVIVVEKKSEQILINSISFEISNFISTTTFQTFFQNRAVVFNKIATSNYVCNANAPPIFERNCQRVFYA
jgi:hypothetical protein